MGYFLSAVLLLVVTGMYCWWIFLPHKELPLFTKKRILCIGDSITFGAGVVPMRWRDSYPAILQQKLGHEYQVLNYGISGATMQLSSDKPYSQIFMDAAEKTEPEICILMLGTNDSKPYNWNPESFTKDMAKRVVRIQDFPSAPKIILAIPPAAFGNPIAYGINDDIIREQIRPILMEYGKAKQLQVIDLYQETKAHPEWFTDGVHPNREGNQRIAEIAYRKLQEILTEGEIKHGD